MIKKPQIKTQISSEIKTKFQNLAKTKGLTEAEFLRKLVIDAIGEMEEKIGQEPKELNSELDRLTIRLPKFLMGVVKEKAKAKGMVKSRWIKSLVQANLTNHTVMTDNEVLVLRESNRELAAIGSNINQIAKVINQSFYKAESLKIEKLNEVMNVINNNRKALKELIRVSKDYWKSEN